MATETAAPRDRTQRLWQVPTFLVGLAALFALWHSGDRLRPSAHEQYKRALAILRPAVDRWPADADRIQAALRRLPKTPPPPEMQAQASYIIGSAYVGLAESTPSPAEATDHWAEARKHLEGAEQAEGLTPQDRSKLMFRLGRTWANSPGVDPARTIEALTKHIACGDDPSEGHRLLAELHLNATPPNDVLAREHLREFLTNAPTRADAKTLNQARIRLAELHAKLGESEEARDVLERVKMDATPELYATARLKLARVKSAEGDVSAAVKIWEQVRDMRGATESQRSEALVQLTEAYAKLNRPADADRAAKAVSGSNGQATAAASFRMAEAKLKDPTASLEAIVAALEAALGKGVGSIPASDARKVCLEVIDRAKSTNEHALAVRTAKVYEQVADGRHHGVTADVYSAWAEATESPEQAIERFRIAAEAAASAARAAKGNPERAERMHQSGRCFARANDRAEAIKAYSELTASPHDYPEVKLAEAWFELGDLQLAENRREQSLSAFQNAADRSSKIKQRAQVRLAGVLSDDNSTKGIESAVALLKPIVDNPPGEDRLAHEEAVYLYGELSLVQRQFPQAEAKLRFALEAYPDSPRAGRGRVCLGQVFRHLASIEARKIDTGRAEIKKFDAERLKTRNASLYIAEQTRVEDRVQRARKAYEDALAAAHVEFSKAESTLLANPKADPVLVRRAMFWAADCAFWLGQYSDAATRYDHLIERYRGKVDELEAAAGLYRTCSYAVDQFTKDKEMPAATRSKSVSEWTKRGIAAFGLVKSSFGKLSPSELDGSTEARQRDYWTKWLADNDPGVTD